MSSIVREEVEEDFPEPMKRCASSARSTGAFVETVLFEVEWPTTATAAAEELGVSLGQITKSLVFELRGHTAEGRKLILICAPGDRRVDRAKLAGVLGVSKNQVSTY